MNIKKIFIILLSLVLAFGGIIPCFAYSDSVLTGEYLTVGDNFLTVDDPDTVSIFYFSVSSEAELGTYRVTSNDKSARLRSYCGTVGYRYDNTDSTNYNQTTNSYTFTVTSVGATYLIGVTGKESFSLTIQKQSDYSIPQYLKDKFSNPVHYGYKKYDFIINEKATRTYVDVTQPHTVVRDNRGLYHLDSIDGPVLYIDIFNTPYVNLYNMASSGMLRYYTYTSSGEYRSKYDESNMYLEYAYYADPVHGIYPYDTHLAGIVKSVGNANGWYDKDRELGYYLFGDTEVNEESAHLFCFFYFEDESLVKRALGYDYCPYNLVYNNPYGNFCEIDGINHSDHSKLFALDVYNNSTVTCMAFTPSGQVYKSFNINYGEKFYKPDKDGILTFTTDGSANILEAVNYGKTNDVTFVLMLSAAQAELSGSGTSADPYNLECDPIGFSSCTIEKNGSLFFNAASCTNTYVVASAYNKDGETAHDVHVKYGNELYYPNASGIITVPLSSKAGRDFEVINPNSEENYIDIILVSDLSFLNPEGTFDNPVKLSDNALTTHMTTKFTDESTGQIYYSFTASKTGVLSFEFKGATTHGWVYSIMNTNTGYSTSNMFTDNTDRAYFSVGVNKGDTVIISMGTYDGMRYWHTPAGEVSWSYKLKNAIKGDADFDMQVNAKDSNIMKRIIAGKMSAPTGEIASYSDLNSDGTLNAVDNNILKRYLAGHIKEL